MADWIKALDSLNVRYTFSIHCHSGIANFVEQGHLCGCHRCRKERGEEWTEETEAQAAADSAIAKQRFREWATKGLTK